jgi:hypothetical protein
LDRSIGHANKKPKAIGNFCENLLFPVSSIPGSGSILECPIRIQEVIYEHGWGDTDKLVNLRGSPREQNG